MVWVGGFCHWGRELGCRPVARLAVTAHARQAGSEWAAPVTRPTLDPGAGPGGVVSGGFMRGGPPPGVGTGHVPGAVEWQDSGACFLICVLCHR